MAETTTLNNGEKVIGNFFLVRATQDGSMMKTGEFGLLRCNDPDFIFKQMPEVDPDPEGEIEDNDHFFEWMEKAQNFREQLLELDAGLKASYDLVKGCYDAGYKDEDGCLEYWLFNYLAQFVKGEK
jgi:hypothetical protein